MTLLRRLALSCLLAAAPLAMAGFALQPGAALAADAMPFTMASFETAKKAGGPILVEVTAPWCPTCKAQKPILSTLMKEPRFAKTTILTVDFDSQKDVLKTLGVRMQSTLISYKGEQEVGRSTGVTDKAAIEAQLGKAI